MNKGKVHYIEGKVDVLESSSIGHVTVQAADKCIKLYTFGVFIDLSKAFDNADHHLLPRKLEDYDIKENYFKLFEI